ncbi:hypothetical protein [Acidiphilium rubrum]|uniref:hypothetical protein n=1 Tax=Acidiphilium rubrum TaxID=526 RepID=UPI002BFDCC24|nr:hypothetical protein [Acidiphilium rubrum]HQT86839.1 hypothetical protein [Acidiphilium rubrum]
MNITISHDGGAIILRIEPLAGDPPVTIAGLASLGSADTAGPTLHTSTVSQFSSSSSSSSWWQSRPVRLLALGVVLVAFIQVGMVVSGASRTAVQPPVAMAPMSLSGGASSGGKRRPATTKHRIVLPVAAIDDALADGAKPIGTVHQPTIAPGTAAAQARFGLDP